MARILCVDDDPDTVAVKREILERAGHSVTACISADEAFLELERQSFDAVVTDWRLGNRLGRSVVQMAKAHSGVPVVVVSGYVSEAFQAAEPLADLYLEKPVDPRELVTVMEALLRARNGSSAGITSEPAKRNA